MEEDGVGVVEVEGTEVVEEDVREEEVGWWWGGLGGGVVEEGERGLEVVAALVQGVESHFMFYEVGEDGREF